MIKKLFAKLTNSWNQIPRLEMIKSNRAEEIMRRDKELAKEREQMEKHRMRMEGIIPRIETDRPIESKEKHDQAT